MIGVFLLHPSRNHRAGRRNLSRINANRSMLHWERVTKTSERIIRRRRCGATIFRPALALSLMAEAVWAQPQNVARGCQYTDDASTKAEPT
jgi:malate/lactate dehydrogenase